MANDATAEEMLNGKNPLALSDNSSVHILLSMRNAPPAPQHPQQLSPGRQDNTCTNPCKLSSCLVCLRGVPAIVLKSPTWSTIMRVVFYTLKRAHPEKEFFNLRTDVYSFMLAHWDTLCSSKDPKHNWKKQVQDMLSHSKNVFESGSGLYKQNGFWRLKHTEDPWTIEKAPRDRSKLRSTSALVEESLKRLSDDESTTTNSEEDIASPQQKKTRLSPAKDEAFCWPRLDNTGLMNELEKLKVDILLMHDKMKQIREELKSREQDAMSQAESCALAQLSNEIVVIHSTIANDVVDINQQVSSLTNSQGLQCTAIPSVIATQQPTVDRPNQQGHSKLPLMAQALAAPLLSVLASSVLSAPMCLAAQGQATS